MAMANHHRDVLMRANELGFFPTTAQVKKICGLAVDEYSKRGGGNPFDEPLYKASNDWAIHFFMEGRAKVRFHRRVTGTAGGQLINEVASAIREAGAKEIRVVIEEI